MKNLFSKKAFLALAASATLLSSCHDNDIYDPSDIVKDYADNWQKTFGDIDPNQDWNLATSITASASLDIPGSSVMKIYTTNPLDSESRLLAITNLNNGVGSISFDAIKGSTSLFVTIHQDNQYIIFSEYPVENGQINIVSGAAKVATRATRAADTWDGNHNCFEANWEDKLKFSLPDGAVDVTNPEYWDEWKNYSGPTGSAYYVPEGYNGEVDLNYRIGISEDTPFYNFGTITELKNVNFNGTVTFYNAGTFTYTVQSGNRHTVVNIGTLIVKSFNNLGNLYNGGSLTFDNWGYSADIPNEMTIYSDGKGTIEFPNGGDLKAVCDIHGTINATGDLNIQNSTKKYICGIVATGKIQNTDSRLETSYMEADDIYFEGNHLYLLPGAHIKANTIEFDKAACDVHAAAGSNALVEVTNNIHFMNDNDFNRTFSDNIYFKVDGTIDMRGQTNGGFADADRILYNSADEYIAKHGNPNNKLNAGNASGNPECGQSWSIQPSTPTPTPGEVEVNDTPGSWIIACEDLGSKDDIDFNDVVFSVEYVAGTTTARVTPLAAGGVYSAEIGYIGDPSFVYEVHDWFNRPGKNGSQKMLNTGVDSGADEDGVTAESKTVTVPQNFKLSYDGANQTNMGGFYIKVSSTTNATTILGSGVGEAPQMILVPGTWKWPKERIKIYDAYPDFDNWSKYNNNSNWYNYPNSYYLY